jgi:hypothetical protein
VSATEPRTSPAPSNPLARRVGQALLGAFVGITLGWVAWALAAPGDFLDMTEPVHAVTTLAAGALGGFGGYRARSRAWRVALVVVAALGGLYWIAAPRGWWASPPPPPLPAHGTPVE